VFKEKQKLIPIVIGSTVTIILFVIITLLSFAPIQLRGSFGPIDIDKAYHFVAYFCLALPLPILRPRLTIWVVLGIMTYGGLIELVQYLFGRESSWGDFIANAIGAIVGAMIANFLGLRLFLIVLENCKLISFCIEK
jgi:VanZ family protein